MTTKRIGPTILVPTLITLFGLELGAPVSYAGSKAIVGSWANHVTVTPPVPPGVVSPFDTFISFTRDGIVLDSSPSPLVNPGHGVWVNTRDREFKATFFLLDFDPTFQLVGRVKVRATLEVNEGGDQYSGESTTEVFDPTGTTLLLSFDALMEGTRILLDPLP
jgi:hypothetical protein